MAIQLDPPIKADLNGNPGIRSFSTLEDIDSFVRVEIDAWQSFSTAVGQLGFVYSNLIARQNGVLQETLNELNNLKLKVKGETIDSSVVNGIIARFTSRACIHSDSDIGRLALSLVEQNHTREAAGVVATATGLLYGQSEFVVNTPWGNFPLLGLLKGASLVSSFEQGLAGRGKRTVEKMRELIAGSESATANAKLAISSLETKSEAMLRSLESERNEFADAATARLKAADAAFLTLQNAHSDKMAAIEAAFHREMELRAPRTYWEKKESGHRRSANWWMSWLVSWGLLLIAAFVEAGRLLLGPNPAITINSTSPASWLLIFGPVVIALWIMRFLNKQATMHLALRQDARERVTLVETYLALFDEEKIREEQLSLVLQSLFRPSSVTGDDGMQVSLLERLVEVISKPK